MTHHIDLLIEQQEKEIETLHEHIAALEAALEKAILSIERERESISKYPFELHENTQRIGMIIGEMRQALTNAAGKE